MDARRVVVLSFALLSSCGAAICVASASCETRVCKGMMCESCEHWIIACAGRRSLAECSADAAKLGCKEQKP
jgi:hypothetical protein